MSTSTTTNGLWSVAADKVSMSAKEGDSTTTYSIGLTFTQQSPHTVKSLNAEVDGASKVPGGPGFATRAQKVRIFKLATKPKVLKVTTTQPTAITGQATVTIEMFVESKIPEDRFYTHEEKLTLREYDLNGSNDLSLDGSTIIEAQLIDGGTQLIFTFPVKVF